LRRIKVILAAAMAMATLMVVTASPAMAQTFFIDRGDFDRFDRGHFVDNVGPADQEFSIRRITSGAANPTTNISNTGNNVNLCTPVQQVANTGNVANEQGVVQNNANNNGFTPVNNGFVPVNGFTTDGFGFFPVDNNFGFGFGNGDLDFEGSSINIEPSATADCTQTINQSAAA
jgi:hypothetical protein